MTEPGKLNIADFSYELPPQRIAEYPLENRDQSKLLISTPAGNSKDYFHNLPGYLPQNSLMVFNNTRVVRARLIFRKETGAMVEIFCLEPVKPEPVVEKAFSVRPPVVWRCFVGNARRWKDQQLTMKLSDGMLVAEKLQREGNSWLISFSWAPAGKSWAEVLEEAGHVPLPPYINREDEPADKIRYQTVYARHNGSVAAPTAGLHFTGRVFRELDKRHIGSTYLTLHVGAGTFKPVTSDRLEEHEMHQEQVIISREALIDMKNKSREMTFAVGTTSVRSMESIFWYANKLASDPQTEFFVDQWDPYRDPVRIERKQAFEIILEKLDKDNSDHLQGATRLMIAPGYSYKMTGGIITNFHQPRSTLLLLVAAFAGNRWKDAYTYALENEFRFLSYGDSCLFLP